MLEAKTLIDKSQWGEGPWVNEHDHLYWVDEVTGYPCIMHRVSAHGAWCGYVAVPPGHPAYHQSYDDVSERVSVHGGLTYADACQGNICHVPEPGQPDNVWWLGFDCGHYGDVTPGSDYQIKAMMESMEMMSQLFGASAPDESPHGHYWTEDEVREEVLSLAKQLKELEGGKKASFMTEVLS